MKIDLQLHSKYSDGYLSPSEVVKYIAQQGVKVASLTDHNTVGGIGEFCIACEKHGIKAIAGLELYIKLHHHRFNLLWYNFNKTDPDLHSVLRNSQLRRRRQVRLLLEKLVDRGFKLNPNKIVDKYNHYVPVNHVVDDIIKEKANLKKIKKELKLQNPRENDILNEYFHNKDIGILKNSFIDIDTVLELKRKIGGQLVLCHPAKHNYISREFIELLIQHNIDGIEVLSPHHSYGAVVYLQQLSYEYKLIATGGSDFHRFEGSRMPIQAAAQYYQINSELLRNIKSVIG